MDLQDFYERYWAGESATPDRDPTTPARKAKLAAALASIAQPAAVLDLGCGRGEFTAFMHGLGFEAWGVDLSAHAISAARAAHPECRFAGLDADGRIPADAHQFAAVWSSEVIEHVFDVHAHLAEINRVLRPEGRYILTTPFHGRLKNVLIALRKFDRHFDPEISHIRFFDRAGLSRCLARAGFSVERWDGVGRVWPLYRSWFVVARKVSPPGPPPAIQG